MRLEIGSSEWEAVGIKVPTGNSSYPASRMLLPYSESVRELLRKALALVEAGIEAGKDGAA